MVEEASTLMKALIVVSTIKAFYQNWKFDANVPPLFPSDKNSNRKQNIIIVISIV